MSFLADHQKKTEKSLQRTGRFCPHGAGLIRCLAMVVAFGISSGVAASEDHDAETISPRGDLLLVIGAPGTPEYGQLFQEWAERWSQAATTGRCRVRLLGGTRESATLEALRAAISEQQSETVLPLWIVLIGHGTFDGQVARFNLPQTDLEPHQLRDWLTPFQRPLAIIDCSAASAPFLEELAAPGRVVIAATSSGNEVNFAHFGGSLSRAFNSLDADLDKDKQVSLLEAFLFAAAATNDFYAADGRLPTEHAILDDNGDGKPVPAEGFEGIRPIHRDTSSDELPDGHLAHQWHLVPSSSESALPPDVLQKRNELERRIALLRQRKEDFSEDDYYAALEALCVELAELLVNRPEETQR